MRHAALAIVGQHDHIALRQGGAILVEFRGQHLARRSALEIHAQQLLLPADHAQLLGRADRAVAMQPGVDAILLQQPLELAAGIVVADDGEQRSPGAQRGAVVRDVGGAAEAELLLFLVHQNHRDRRLGRDPLDFAEPVAVQHHVPDDQHACPAHRFSEMGKLVQRHCHQRLPMPKYSSPASRT